MDGQDWDDIDSLARDQYTNLKFGFIHEQQFYSMWEQCFQEW